MSESAAARTTCLALFVEGGLGATALVVGWLVGHWPGIGIDFYWASLAEARPQLEAATFGLLATVPLLAALWLIDRFPIGPLRSLRQLAEDVIPRMFAGATIWQLALISLAAGFGEELLFRGLVQAGLSRLLGDPLGPWIALLAASLLFGACHWLSATYAAAAALAGCYFGLIFLVSGNLWTPIITHATYDFLALLYLLRANHLLGSRV